MATTVRLPMYLASLLQLFGSEAEKGRVILFFLISVDRPFRLLAREIPEDNRNNFKILSEIRDLVDRYSGLLTDEKAEKLYQEFMHKRDNFVKALREFWAGDEVLDAAQKERVALGAALGDRFLNSHLKKVFKENVFAVLLRWLRVLRIMHPKAIPRILEALKESGNSQAAAIFAGAEVIRRDQGSKGGKKRAEAFEAPKQKLFKAWDEWKPSKGKKTVGEFLRHHNDDMFEPLRLDPSVMRRWLNRRGL